MISSSHRGDVGGGSGTSYARRTRRTTSWVAGLAWDGLLELSSTFKNATATWGLARLRHFLGGRFDSDTLAVQDYFKNGSLYRRLETDFSLLQ